MILYKFLINYKKLINYLDVDLIIFDNSQDKKISIRNRKNICKLSKTDVLHFHKNVSSYSLKQNTKLYYYNSPANLGGAGGFNWSTKFAVKKKYNFLWLLDDDCEFSISTLTHLLRHYQRPQGKVILASLTLGSDKNNLSPPVTVLNKTTTSVKTNLSKNNYSFFYKKTNLPQTALFESTGNFFNSVLLPSKVFRDVGYPNAKYFIWGDENDFLYRCWERGYIVKVAKASEVYTNNFINYNQIKFFNHALNIPNLSDKKLYFMIRNSFILNSKYNLCKFARLKAFLLSSKYFVFELFFAKKGDAFRRCKLIISAFLDAPRMFSGKNSNGF